MAKFTNPTNGVARTEDYRFTITDMRDFELAQLKDAAKTHNKAVRAAVRAGKATLKSWKNKDYSLPQVSLMRVHIMPRGPRTAPSQETYGRSRAYDSYLPQKFATHFDVYFREDTYNNEVLQQEVDTGLTSAQQRKVSEANYELMLAEMAINERLREAGICVVHTPEGKQYTTVENKIQDLRDRGVSEDTIERII